MNLPKLQLDYEDITDDLQNLSLFAIAKKVREEYPDIQLYLLESAGGPRIDTQQSVLGLGSILCVEIKNGIANFSGETELVDAARVRLSCGNVDTTNPSTVMNFIRAIETSVEVLWSDGSIANLPLITVIGYDAIAPMAPRSLLMPIPELFIIVPRMILTINHWANRFSIMRLRYSGAPEAIDRIYVAIKNHLGNIPDDPELIVVADSNPVHLTVSASQYIQHANIGLEHILAGDIYQVQLGHEVLIQSNEPPFLIYERLRILNPSPYMFFVTAPSVALVGASPELFVRVDAGLVQMRPLAGTLPKTTGCTNNRFSQDPKEKAEHIMLVDLCRNDIGRVSQIGSVHVSQLIAVEEYPSVFHLVSTINGQLRDDLDGWDVIEACSPAGTMTGTPKIRATEIIADLEWTRRGLYAGSVVFSNGCGNLVSALIIRSLVVQDGWISVRASAGIVADSVPEKEWQETLAKIKSSLIAVTSAQL